jgi:mono/diheme cytochrome c family protein
MQTQDKVELLERRRRRVVRQPQTIAVAGLLVVAALIAGIFYLGNEPATQPGDEPFFPGQVPGPDTLPGQVLFSLTCSPCHGVTAAGNPGAGIPPLNSAGDAWQLTGSEIETIIMEGTPKMPGNAALLEPEEVRQIIEFLQTLWTEEQRAAFEAGN